jgi:hypothetical protein
MDREFTKEERKALARLYDFLRRLYPFEFKIVSDVYG